MQVKKVKLVTSDQGLIEIQTPGHYVQWEEPVEYIAVRTDNSSEPNDAELKVHNCQVHKFCIEEGVSTYIAWSPDLELAVGMPLKLTANLQREVNELSGLVMSRDKEITMLSNEAQLYWNQIQEICNFSFWQRLSSYLEGR